MAESPAEDTRHCREQLDHALLEVERLRARIVQLEADKAALIRASIERDYERPPHYL